MALIYLAYGSAGMPTLLDPRCGPARLLVSYAWEKDFRKLLERGYRPQEWVLDSGAYSFKHSGTPVTVDDFCRGIDMLVKCAAGPPSEIYALDVIGDWRATYANVRTMERRGYNAIPCFHLGEPFDVLKTYAQNYPKVAIGGVARIRGGAGLRQFLDKCFAAAWPVRIHGFAAVRPDVLRDYPFDSVDSSTWCRTAQRYGWWAGMGELKIRDVKEPMIVTVRHYQKMERESEGRWASDLARIRAPKEVPA
jgi:hypothetical protein